VANLTERAKIGVTGYENTKRYLPAVTTAQTYYPGGCIGLNASGYADKMDDSALFTFQGFYSNSLQYTAPSGLSALDPLLNIEVDRPQFVEIAVSSAAVTDVGKKVYTSYDGTFTYTPTTYRNSIGVVDAYIDSTHVRVRCDYGLRRGTEFLVALDAPSLTTNTASVVTLTVPGLLTTDVVQVQPQAAFTAGVVICHFYISAADTLKVTVLNITAGTVDEASHNVLVRIL